MADNIIFNLLHKANNLKLRGRRDLKTHERLLPGTMCLLVFLHGVTSTECLVEALRYIVQSSNLQMFFKVGALKIFAIFIGKHLRWSLFLITLQALDLQLCQKVTPTQVFSCQEQIFCRTSPVASSE